MSEEQRTRLRDLFRPRPISTDRTVTTEADEAVPRGILITALLWPAFEWMLRHRFPRWLAVAVSILGTIAVVTTLLWLVVWQVRAQLPDVQARSAEATCGTLRSAGNFFRYCW